MILKTSIDLKNKTILVTGSAGFIGANLVKRLLQVPGACIVGIDNLNNYYDVTLKEYRLAQLEKEAEASLPQSIISLKAILRTVVLSRISLEPIIRTL